MSYIFGMSLDPFINNLVDIKNTQKYTFPPKIRVCKNIEIFFWQYIWIL